MCCLRHSAPLVILFICLAIMVSGCDRSSDVNEQAGKREQTEATDEDAQNGSHTSTDGNSSNATALNASSTSESHGPIQVQKVSVEQFQKIIDEHKGEVVFVDYWATWCLPCIQEFPHTLELAKTHADQGFVAISLSCDQPDDEEKVLNFLKRKDAQIRNLLTDKGYAETFEQFDIRGGIPFYTLYDRQGNLRYRFSGVESRPDEGTEAIAQIDTRVLELLAEEVPATQ